MQHFSFSSSCFVVYGLLCEKAVFVVEVFRWAYSYLLHTRISTPHEQ